MPTPASSSDAGPTSQPDTGSDAEAPEPDAADPPLDPGNASDEQAPSNSARGDALSEAYAALTSGDRTRIQAIVSAIDRQSQQQPDNAYAVFYAGAFRLWQLSESLDITAAPGVLDNLERAHMRLPNDFRVSGFYGLSQVMLGSFGDPQLTEAGLKTLALAVDQHSTYGHFLRATAVSTLPTTHPAFKTAITDMQGVGPDCQVMIDAEGVYHYPTDERPGRSRICTNDGIVPHAWEGYFASFGDIALKSGWDATRARALYRSAKTAPTYETWPFKQELEQRIADAEGNAAALADSNPLNDPPTWALGGKICVGCHQAK